MLAQRVLLAKYRLRWSKNMQNTTSHKALVKLKQELNFCSCDGSPYWYKISVERVFTSTDRCSTSAANQAQALQFLTQPCHNTKYAVVVWTSCLILRIYCLLCIFYSAWRRVERPRSKGRGPMFDSLSRLRYSRPFHFEA